MSRAPIAILGDLQRTSRIERFVLGREQNDRERELLIDAIASERPCALVLLGDLVCFGARARDWRRFDRLIRPIRELGIPLLPILGNHDTWGGTQRGLAHLRERFPRLRESFWYEERFGPLSLLFLDSNARRLGSKLWREQRSWLEEVLAAAARDSSVHSIIAFVHHPPFTNSRVTGDTKSVQEDLLPPILESSVPVTLISGHVHAFEWLEKHGRDFLVLGSGGGPRVRGLEGDRRRHLEANEAPWPRPFVFGLLTEEDGARLEVRALEKGERLFRTLEALELKSL
ncbi:MAG: metallophosphoesterase family protein [Planctomycetota bacterium]